MNLSQECTSKQVKKVYRKLVSKFHPDKNDSVEEDIFNHIVIAYQILSNPIEKNSYDNYIGNKKISHHKKKESYDSTDFKSNDSYEISKKKYNEKVKKLEEKHKLKNIDNTDPLIRIKSLQNVRNQVKINYETILDKDDFNNKFNKRRTVGSDSKKKSELINTSKNSYALLNSYSELYINDSVISDKYSSLDNAFNLNPAIEFKEDSVSNKIKKYKNESEYLKNLPSNKYLNMQYQEWKK
tara:strand:- start:2273 stop:2992 length:720 start_codon:yes stop_codon:yes gene_type:complete